MENSGRGHPGMAPSRIERKLIPWAKSRIGFPGSIQGIRSRNHDRIAGSQNRGTRIEIAEISDYSAAAASEAFGFAADIMKSEMRGTISDLNREPLNTP